MNQRLPLLITLIAGLFAIQLGWWGLQLWHKGDEVYQSDYNSLIERQQFETKISGEAQLNMRDLRALEERRHRHRVMVIGEGSFFLLLWGFAVWFLLRTARRDRQVVLQESNFLHSVTHEFRSPLQALRLAVESLQRRPDPTRAIEYGKMMVEDIGRLESLVDNVLLVGRLDARALNPQISSIDLSRAINISIKAWKHSNPAFENLLSIKIADDIYAEADPAAFNPIIHNLLDNARKYGEGSQINVTLKSHNGLAVLDVSDKGVGFSAKQQTRLFERFWRAGDERVRTSPGTGLGLYLVAELVHAQGATINAHSPGTGNGACFSIKWATTTSHE